MKFYFLMNSLIKKINIRYINKIISIYYYKQFSYSKCFNIKVLTK